VHAVRVAFAPGRANLIGEHTDYNGGLALPFAIEEGVEVRAEPLAGDELRAQALDLGETDHFGLADPSPAEGWRAFVRGVVAELRAAGVEVAAADLRISATVPRGAGLSSSAALEVALALALGGGALERVELAKLCSRVENDWVGARTGLLDQLASLFGEAGHALRVDFRTLAVEPVPLDLADHRLVTLDSGESRGLAASGYNERRAECEEATARLGLATLRDATLDQAATLPAPLDRRARHVITENSRVEKTVNALRHGHVEAIGPLLDASHASLRDDYDASTPAVEATVERLRAAGALGARMMGGGFGGTVLGLFAPDATLPTEVRDVRPSAGARVST
jgi:galactokinase